MPASSQTRSAIELWTCGSGSGPAGAPDAAATAASRRAGRRGGRGGARATGGGRGGPGAGVVAAALGPRVGVGEGRPAVRIPAAAGTARPAAALVVLVVALAEEPDQPHDQRADVEDAQPDHENPSGQRHSAWSLPLRRDSEGLS